MLLCPKCESPQLTGDPGEGIRFDCESVDFGRGGFRQSQDCCVRVLRSQLAAVSAERNKFRDACLLLVECEHPKKRNSKQRTECGYCGKVKHEGAPFCPVMIAEEALKEPKP